MILHKKKTLYHSSFLIKSGPSPPLSYPLYGVASAVWQQQINPQEHRLMTPLWIFHFSAHHVLNTSSAA